MSGDERERLIEQLSKHLPDDHHGITGWNCTVPAELVYAAVEQLAMLHVTVDKSLADMNRGHNLTCLQRLRRANGLPELRVDQ